jgi:hypothetical protein
MESVSKSMTQDAKTAVLSMASKEAAGAAESSAAPIIVDIGKSSRKEVRKLRKGKPGKLMSQVAETVEHLRENGVLAAGVTPLVIIVRQRRSRRRLTKMLGLGS